MYGRYFKELLPIKIYGSLESVYISNYGELVLCIRKKNTIKQKELYRDLKSLEGSEVFVLVDHGKWDKDLPDL